MIEIIIMILGQALFFGFLTTYVALKKNIKYGFGWGFLLGIVGLVVIAGLPVEKLNQEAEESEWGLDGFDVAMISMIIAILAFLALVIVFP